MPDHLLDWLRVRAQLDWVGAARRPVHGPVSGRRDGVVEFVRTRVAAYDAARADRLLAALADVRSAAAAGLPLTFDLLAGWHGTAMGAPPAIGFRTGPAFAKRGRDRYGLHADTAARFRACLAEATGPGVPLAARVARAYLDVAFFHPFDDGNGRAGMLALYFLLLRDDVVLAVAAPVLVTVRRADDPDGTLALVELIELLIGGCPAETRTRQY